MSRSLSVHLLCRIGLTAIILILLPTKSSAQNDGYLTNSNTRGLAPMNSFQIADIDSINVANGAVNLRIPVSQRKGRGIDNQYFFWYSSKIWIQVPFWDPVNPTTLDSISWEISPTINGVSSTLPLGGFTPAKIVPNEQVYDCWISQVNNYYEETVDFDFTYLLEDGSSYRLPNLHRDLSPDNRYKCTTVTPQAIGYSDNGTVELDTTAHPYIAHLKDGSQNTYGDTCCAWQNTDTNGNFLNANGDTLKRVVGYASQSGLQTYTFTDSTGTSQNITVQSSSGASATTQFPTASCSSVPISQFTGYMGGTNTITLPDGRTYVLTYDPVFSEVTKVTLPTGGYIRYQYTTLASFDQGGYCSSGIDSRRLSARFVSPDGTSQHEQEWQYAYANAGGTYTTTVTDPLGNVTVHTFGSLGVANTMHETMTQYYDNAGHLLRTEANTWAYDYAPVASYPTGKFISSLTKNDYKNWRITAKTTTLADTNQVNQVQTNFDSFTYTFNGSGYTESRSNVTSKLEYDWGNGSSGPLLRRTVFTYLHDSNSNYLNKHILDRAASKTIYDSTSNQCQGLSQACSQTTYGYDTTTIAAQAGVVQHDYTDYPSSMIYRGNRTRVSTWRNTDNSWLTTTNYYDELGNILQTSDPLSHSTSFTYTDSWSGTTCIPSGGTANAFPTKTTNALTQFATAKYFPCSSLVASTTDLNSQTTSYTYDGLDRLTQQTFADGGLKTNCYSDTTGSSCYSVSVPPYVVTTVKINSTQNLVDTTLVDGLGRIAQTQLSDPQNTVFTDITYDGMGRQSTVSNPYRSPNDSTYGVTTNIYDALGRSTMTVPPDGTIPTGSTCPSNDVCTTYSGNTTNVTDQAGHARESITDGVGRLTEVIENPGGLAYQTNYTYDALNDLTNVVQNSSRQRTFVYNSLAQLTSSTNPESNTTPSGTTVATTYSYDPDGNVMQKTMPAQNQQSTATVTLTYCYDPLNRLTAKGYAAETCSNGIMPTPVATYWYDGNTPTSPSGCSTGVSNYGLAIGKRTAMCDPAGVESWTYTDVQNTGWQTVQKRTTNSVTMSTTTQDNLVGSPATIMYPSGRTITYTYDSAVRPSDAQDVANNINYALGTCVNGLSSNGVCYAPNGAIGKIQNGSNLVSTFLYNTRLQPCWIYATTGTALATTTACAATDPGPANILDLKYNFNLGTTDNGNVMAITNNRDTTRSQNFYYDALNRLLTAETISTSGTNCWGESYIYDNQSSGSGAWGNLTNINVASSSYNTCTQETLSATVNTQNRLSTNGYDTAGNAITYGTSTYAYNAENQMTQASSPSATGYVYDGDGNRAEKVVGGSATKLYWQGGTDTLDETDGTGSITNGGFNEYVFFGGRRIARRDSSSNVFYYVADHLDTTREIVQAGQTSACYESDSYPFGGERTPIVNTCSWNNYKFTGKERDAESNLDDFEARYYSSGLGRLISPDSTAYTKPINPQNWNLYAYALNNPLRYVDPTGHIVSLANCTDKKKCATLIGDAAQLPNGVTTDVDKNGNLILKGDLNKIKGGNALRLLQLVNSTKTANFWIGDVAPGRGTPTQSVGGGLSGLTSQGYNQNFAVVQADPSKVDSGDLARGAYLASDGTVDHLGKITGATQEETAAHELLGHVWADLIGGQTAGTDDNKREALIAEDRVRNTDPDPTKRGLKIYHQGGPESRQLIRMTDLPRITNPGSEP